MVASGHRRARYAAVPAIAFMGWAAWHATTDASWLPRGGLLAHAAATSILIAACAGGVWRRALGWRPLAALGLISYGVYLYHWPIYLWITPASTGWGRWPTTAVRVAVTLALAVASYLLLERHVVALRPRQRHTLAVGGAGVALALFVASVASPSASADERVTLAEGLVAPANAALATPTPPTAAPPSVPRSAMPAPTTAVPTTQASAPPHDVPAAVDDTVHHDSSDGAADDRAAGDRGLRRKRVAVVRRRGPMAAPGSTVRRWFHRRSGVRR